MKKQIIIISLLIFQYQVAFSQSDSLKFGLKGKVIRALTKSPTSPSVFYAGLKGRGLGSGLLYKSSDFGETWHVLNNGKPINSYTSDIQAIAISTNKNKIIYVGTWKNGLYKSSDEGKTWKQDITFPSSDVRSIKVGIQNPNLVYVATSIFGVIKSIDGGNTWARNKPEVIDRTFQFAWSIELDPNNDNIIYAQTYKKGIWKSINKGETWEQVLDTEGKVCWDLKISKNSNEMWVASSIGGKPSSSIYHSIDNGNTWQEIADVPQIGVSQIDVVESKNDNTIIIGSWQNGVFIFKDDKWTKADSIDFKVISEILINNNKLLIGSWGNGIYQLKL